MKVWLFIYKKIASIVATKIRKAIKKCVVVSVIIKTQNGQSLGHKNCNIVKSKVSRINLFTNNKPVASFPLFYKGLVKTQVFTLPNIVIQSFTLEPLCYKRCYTNVIQMLYRFFWYFRHNFNISLLIFRSKFCPN